jgi:hypothetical protein
VYTFHVSTNLRSKGRRCNGFAKARGTNFGGRFLENDDRRGFLFLLPVVLLVIVLGHAMRLAGQVAEPISKLVPVHALGGVGKVTVLAVLDLIRRRSPRPHYRGQAHDALVGKHASEWPPAISIGEEHGLGACTGGTC